MHYGRSTNNDVEFWCQLGRFVALSVDHCIFLLQFSRDPSLRRVGTTGTAGWSGSEAAGASGNGALTHSTPYGHGG